MNSETTDEILRRAAWRASQNPFFLAGNIEVFRTRRNMQESDLARFLSCGPEILPRLGLCRRPDPDSPTFRSDVNRVADAFGLHASRLVQLIRETDALDVLGNVAPVDDREVEQGLLIAARDKELGEPERSEPADECDRGEEEVP